EINRALLAKIEGADDVGVVEGGPGTILLEEAFAQDLVREDALRRHLDGDKVAVLAVTALVDRRHAPLADLGEELVVSQCLHFLRRADRLHRRTLLRRTAFVRPAIGFSLPTCGYRTDSQFSMG